MNVFRKNYGNIMVGGLDANIILLLLKVAKHGLIIPLSAVIGGVTLYPTHVTFGD